MYNCSRSSLLCAVERKWRPVLHCMSAKDELFALAEGENETLEGWREEHRDYLSRNGGFEPEMMLV